MQVLLLLQATLWLSLAVQTGTVQQSQRKDGGLVSSFLLLQAAVDPLLWKVIRHGLFTAYRSEAYRSCFVFLLCAPQPTGWS